MNILGVMASRVIHPDRFDPYDEVAREAGFDRVLVYRPEDVNLTTGKISGFVREQGSWNKRIMNAPPITFDIGYYHDPKVVGKVRQIKNTPSIAFLNYGLGNKWMIHQKLFPFETVRPHLIPTEVVVDGKQVMDWMERYGAVILKPINGKEGKGIVRLSKTGENGSGGPYLLEEQMNKKPLADEQGAIHQIERILQSGRYIVQKWIPIVNREGLVYDVRSLVQKNQKGRWEITGLAARQGAAGKITSNLMDGGTAFELLPYLKHHFGKKKSRKLYQKIKELSLRIPGCLEEAYARRQADLGLDLAIDPEGEIYLIEVNVKPGKLPFRQVFGIHTKQDSIRQPIYYAASLLGIKA
ncbi:YheC/YheD family protein [Brevibacillus ginsengisoli]|uniref:YheC/YheD family endospore coat-associated protein n=1 Tax=Brevibacillus ginsengisoli TaxID=363854 RepID=UPI003CF7C6AD